MPVSFIDRYEVTGEDFEAAMFWAVENAKRLGLICDKQISRIAVYDSEELWVGGEGEEMELNRDTVTLEFDFGGIHYPDRDRSGYLRRISYDPGQEIPQVDWRVSESSGDPPESLEELLRVQGSGSPVLRKRAVENQAFFAIYLGIMQRLFPQVEHEDVHTDTGNWEEARTSPSHIKKEIWRTDLLTSLQGLRFPPFEIEDIGKGEGHLRGGVRVIWEPQGHTNYMIWFNLYIGEDPKICAYCDPTQTGSTTGWLSTRLLKNEAALAKLPYTLEQWAIEDLEDLRKKRDPEYANWRKSIRELLRHHFPRDFEEVYGAIRQQIVGVPQEDVHTDTGAYESRLTEAVEEEEERYYGIATGDGNSGVSRMSPHYIVLTDKLDDLAELAAHAMFQDDPAIQEWVGKNMEIQGDYQYGITVMFPESMEYQAELKAAQEEYERRREEAEEAGEEFEEEDPSDEFSDNTTWFMIEIFPIEASEVDRYRCEVYDSTDHPGFLEPLFPPVEHEDVHTDTGSWEESLKEAVPRKDWRSGFASIDLSWIKQEDFPEIEEKVRALGKKEWGFFTYNVPAFGAEYSGADGLEMKFTLYLPGAVHTEGSFMLAAGLFDGRQSPTLIKDKRYFLTNVPIELDALNLDRRPKIKKRCAEVYAKFIALFKLVEDEEVHTDTGAYESAFLSHLPEQFRLKG
jgi:hypothetical protein